MGIIDEVVDNVRSAADAVGRKAERIVDITKLKISAGELNVEINKRFQELGKSVYAKKKNGSVNEAELEEPIAEIDDLYQQLDQLLREIGALQNKITCPVCKKQCPIEASYCLYCGAKLVEDPVPEDSPEENGEAPPEE